MATKKNQDQGTWKTINGAHIYIPLGDDKPKLKTSKFDKINKLPAKGGKKKVKL